MSFLERFSINFSPGELPGITGSNMPGVLRRREEETWVSRGIEIIFFNYFFYNIILSGILPAFLLADTVAAVTNYPKLGGLKHRNLLSPSSGGQKSRVSITGLRSRHLQG